MAIKGLSAVNKTSLLPIQFTYLYDHEMYEKNNLPIIINTIIIVSLLLENNILSTYIIIYHMVLFKNTRLI